MPELTPMMRQYFEIKNQYDDTILMYRLGDFYEMFYADAIIASKELELVLTGRDCGQEERAPMCGVPFHSADSYIAKLISKGYKVAVCEQAEDPALAKGLVKREVVRVLTPGTVIESSMLDETKNNFLASIYYDGEKAGICFADISTGKIKLTQTDSSSPEAKIINELGNISPSEIIMNEECQKLTRLKEFMETKFSATAEVLDNSCFFTPECADIVLKHFNITSFSDIGLEGELHAISALGAIIDYLRNAQKSDLDNLKDIDFYSDAQFLGIDVASRRNLEICENMRSREKRGTLLWVLDRTKTPMGKRLLRSWLEQPLYNLSRIIRRHNSVEELLENSSLRADEMLALSGILDMERLMARIVYKTGNAKELKALSAAISHLPSIKSGLCDCKSEFLCEINNDIDLLKDIYDLIENAISEEPPFTVREGGMIKAGYNSELDELSAIVHDGKGYIAAIQTNEQERTGIKKLKIGYNRVFGYYIEILNSYSSMVPDDYIRKQTLANCERYITQELKELEAKVLGAQERIVKLEYELFSEIRDKTAESYLRIRKTADAVARLDVICSFAQAAFDNSYCRPEINTSNVIEIKEGRHPVVEKMVDMPFVPNDTLLDCGENRCAIITGPNMSGKSTFMRQVALIVLMAQAGSFVPAKSARLCLVDKIFTRVGASDDLASGQSTFMVEMSEVAYILQNASAKSLIVFDEIGRGTSTFDGMSIARAVLEYVSDRKKIGAKTLFATHYHELTELENALDGIKNYNVAVKKRGDNITFLRRIVSGGADGSYGIEVAKLAGVPGSVVSRAKTILAELEKYEYNSPIIKRKPSSESQISFEQNNNSKIIDILKSIDIDTLTPIEALSELNRLRQLTINN